MGKKARFNYILSTKDTNRLKVSRRKRYSVQIGNKRAKVAMLISDKVDFKLKSFGKTKKGILY